MAADASPAPATPAGPADGHPRRRLDALSGLAMAVAWVGVLAHALAGVTVLVPLTLGALALYMAVQAGRLTWTARAHLSVGALVAAVAVARLEEPGPLLVDGLNRAAFLAALFVALGVLREAARTSPMVLETGRMLVRQPPGRRYAAITVGGTLFGAILNFGAVALLGGMVKDVNTLQAAEGEEHVRAIRERRMLLAVLRGFSVLMFWCPLTVAYAMVGATVVGADWPRMMLYGTGATVAVLVLGWSLDRLTMPRPRVPADRAPFQWLRLGPLLGLIAVVFALAFLIEQTTQGRLVHGVILVVPLLGLAWVMRGAGGRAGLGRMGAYLTATVPTQRTEITILGNAAFLGAVIAGLLPHDVLEGLTDGLGVPAAVVLALLPWLVVAAGQVGANPLITATVLAAVVGDAGRLGLDPSVVGLALVMGWGLTVGSSPATAATMMVARMTDRTPAGVGRGWNGVHTVLALVLCSGVLMGLHAVA